MKNIFNLRKQFYLFLLMCLGTSPMAMVASVGSAARISQELRSPSVEDQLLFSRSMPFALVENP